MILYSAHILEDTVHCTDVSGYCSVYTCLRILYSVHMLFFIDAFLYWDIVISYHMKNFLIASMYVIYCQLLLLHIFSFD